MGADPARDGCEAGLILVRVRFAGGELDQDLSFAHRLTNTAGNGFNPASARGREAKDGFHRLKHYQYIAARDFLAFDCRQLRDLPGQGREQPVITAFFLTGAGDRIRQAEAPALPGVA